MEEIGFLDALAQAREEDDQIFRLTQLRQELKGLDLSELELRDCHFHGCRFTDCDFSGAVLERCLFHSCQLVQCRFGNSCWRDTALVAWKAEGRDFRGAR